jgi:hypothetical protein
VFLADVLGKFLSHYFRKLVVLWDVGLDMQSDPPLAEGALVA